MLSGGVIRWRRLVQHPPHFALFTLRQWRRAGSLRLQQCTEKDSIVQLGAVGAEVAVVDPLSYVLGLKDLRLSYLTALAQHASSIAAGVSRGGLRKAQLVRGVPKTKEP